MIPFGDILHDGFADTADAVPARWVRPIGCVVILWPVIWNGTFHQWSRRGLAANRILPEQLGEPVHG